MKEAAMKEAAGIVLSVFLVLLLSGGIAELISPEDCRAWLAEFEREIAQMEPLPGGGFCGDPADPDLVFAQYAFGYVERRGKEIVSVTLITPAMADCRDGYIGMPFEWGGAQRILPVETQLISRDPDAFFWTYADEGGCYAAEWIAMDEERAYTLTCLSDQDGRIGEIRFRQSDLSGADRRETMDAAGKLLREEPEEGGDPGEGKPAGEE